MSTEFFRRMFLFSAPSIVIGYALCLGVHRHDAGEDFRRGREQGWKESTTVYQCGTEEWDKKFAPQVPDYGSYLGKPKPKLPPPNCYPAADCNPK